MVDVFEETEGQKAQSKAQEPSVEDVNKELLSSIKNILRDLQLSTYYFVTTGVPIKVGRMSGIDVYNQGSSSPFYSFVRHFTRERFGEQKRFPDFYYLAQETKKRLEPVLTVMKSNPHVKKSRERLDAVLYNDNEEVRRIVGRELDSYATKVGAKTVNLLASRDLEPEPDLLKEAA